MGKSYRRRARMRPSSWLRGSRSLELAWLCLQIALAAACGSAGNAAKPESPRGNTAVVDAGKSATRGSDATVEPGKPETRTGGAAVVDRDPLLDENKFAVRIRDF